MPSEILQCTSNTQTALTVEYQLLKKKNLTALLLEENIQSLIPVKTLRSISRFLRIDKHKLYNPERWWLGTSAKHRLAASTAGSAAPCSSQSEQESMFHQRNKSEGKK